MGTPKVRKMVMFKHGVAYIERAGAADGPFELAFKRDEMNDVLKSLTLWVADGDARVGAVAFEKPEDPEEALVRRKLNYPAGGTLFAMLASMRGRKVAVTVDGTRVEGEVVGTEQAPDRDGGERRSLVLREGASMSLVDIARITKVDLEEESARADLAFFVDRSRAASTGENRIVRVDVHGRCNDLRVSYVVPAPAWRVSYRVAREGETTHLMAWGIVHNPVEEDLDDLALVLTTGQPVSFVIDLYNPKSVRRAVVEEEDRAVSAPTRFERARKMAPPPPPAAAPAFGPPGFGGPPPAPRMAMAAMPMLAEADDELEATSVGRMLGGGDDAASFGDKGELFEYRVGPRISLKRGGSAMVPLLAVKVDAKKERIWRIGAPPAPDLVLSFANTSGAVLEEGAAVVYDGDVYAGEAMVPYSARGTDVKISFAKDLAVRCAHKEVTSHATSALRIMSDSLRVDSRSEWTHTFSAESDHDEPVTVTFEMPVYGNRKLVPGTAEPFETTASYRRFSLEVPAGRRAELVVKEFETSYSRSEYAQLRHAQIDEWLAARLLEVPHATAMKEALGLFESWRALDRQQKLVQTERQTVYERQRRINEQLAVLKDGGPEAQLRLRYVRELEAAQDELVALDVKEKRLQAEADEAAKAAWRVIGAEAKKATPT